MSPASHFFFVENRKTVVLYVPKKNPFARQKNSQTVFRHQTVISFYPMGTVHIAFIACDIAFIAFVACDIAFIACDIAFVAFIACDNAGGAVLGNVVRADDFERRVLHDVRRRRCGGGGGGRGRRRGLDGAAEARRCRRRESSSSPRSGASAALAASFRSPILRTPRRRRWRGRGISDAISHV
jgi:hypothetical protein